MNDLDDSGLYPMVEADMSPFFDSGNRSGEGLGVKDTEGARQGFLDAKPFGAYTATAKTAAPYPY